MDIEKNIKIFSFLVGINDYKSQNIPNLNGCLNDIKNISSFLANNFSDDNLEITTLLNEKATYQNIIDTFRNEIRNKVQNQDTVLFYYSGHGSRQVSAPEFNQFFAEIFDETIVCYDSRTDGIPDLADKELAVLIDETEKKGAKIIFILDSCHSGSNTRSETAKNKEVIYKQATDNFNQRKIESYINGYYSNLIKENKFTIPRSKHILLSACDKNELAKETQNQTGLFSQTLLETLNKNRHLSYSNLFVKIRKHILKYDIDQKPQLEAYEGFNPNTEFLTGLPIEKQKYHDVFYNPQEQKWQVDIGVLNNLSNNPQKPSKFEIYELIADKYILKNTVDSLEVLLDKSYLNMPKLQFNTNNQYFAKSLSIPEMPFFVKISAEKEIIQLFNDNCPVIHNIEFNKEIENSKYSIVAENNQIELFNNYPETKLIRKIVGDKKQSVIHILEILCKILKWERIIDVKNNHSQLSQLDFEFNIYDEENQKIDFVGDNYEIIFNQKPIKLILKAKNNSQNELNFNLLYLSDSFGISSLTNNITCPVDSDYVTLWGTNENDYFFLPETKNQSIDIFKLIISTESTDTFNITQNPVEDIGKTRELNTRDIGSTAFKETIKISDWTTKTLEIYMHK